MSSINGVTPSDPTGLTNEEISVFNTLAGHYLSDVSKVTISDTQALSMQAYNTLLGSAQVNTLHMNEAILSLGPSLAAAFFRYIATTASSLANLFYSEEATYLTDTTDAAGRKPLVAAINSDNTAVNNAVSAQNTAYNTLSIARTAYINATNALASPPTTTQLTNYNNARATYYDAVTAYNTAVATTNTANTNYANAVSNYQSYLTNTVDPDIDKLNASRTKAGISPSVPYPTIPLDVSSFTVNAGSAVTNLTSRGPISLDSNNHFPSGEPQQPASLPSITLPTQFPEVLVDPTTLKLSNYTQTFIVNAQPLFNQWIQQQVSISNSSANDNPVGKDYQDAVGTLPISYIHSHLGEAQAAGGAQAMTSYITGLDLVSINAIVPHDLYNNFYAGTTAIPSPALYNQLLLTTITAGSQIANISSPTGALYLGEVPNSLSVNSTAINTAVATGNLNTVIGLLNGGGLTTALSALTDANSAFQSLTPAQKASLQESLSALASNGLLQLNVAALTQQLGVPSTNQVFGAALLTANPTAPENQPIFAQLAQQFQTLEAQYGAQGVLTPLTTYLEEQLVKNGLSSNVAAPVVNQLTNALTTNGLGQSATDLQNQINAILAANVNPQIAQLLAPALFENVVTFTAAAYQKQAAQSALIQNAGASQANQAENTTLALYGISVNFGEGTVSYAQTSDQRPNSVIQLAISNDQQLLKTSKQAALNQAYDNWLSAAQTNVSLDAYIRTKLMDPGHRITETGLMAQGSGGTQFKRGQIDMDISGI